MAFTLFNVPGIVTGFPFSSKTFFPGVSHFLFLFGRLHAHQMQSHWPAGLKSYSDLHYKQLKNLLRQY